jgi:hypothetical protein
MTAYSIIGHSLVVQEGQELGVLCPPRAHNKPAGVRTWFIPSRPLFSPGAFPAAPSPTRRSGRDQKTLDEGPFVIDPLRLAAETSGRGEPRHFLGRVLVAALRPDRFVLAQRERESHRAQGDGLRAGRAQVHLDAARGGVVAGQMPEPRQREVGVELAVDAREQVDVEGGRVASISPSSRRHMASALREISMGQ